MTPAWTTSDAIAKRQGCSSSYLREMMLATPDHIARPWVPKGRGTGRNARYSWEIARVDQWWREVQEWLASRSVPDSPANWGLSSPRLAINSLRYAPTKTSSVSVSVPAMPNE